MKKMNDDERIKLISNFVFRDSKLKSFLKILKTGTVISLLALIGVILSSFALEFKSRSLEWKYIISTGILPALYLLVQLVRIVLRLVFINKDWYQNRSAKAVFKDIIEILKD